MLILTATQQVTYTASFKDAKGNPARVDGIPTWEASNAALVELTPAEDGMTCQARALGGLGESQVSVQGDADTDEGVRHVVGIDTVQIVAGEAVTAGMEAGTPEEQPVVTPVR